MNPALFDLSPRAKFRVSGTDRLRYLNGQITNDARKATEASALYACILNAKGRINADLFLVVDGESFLLDADPALREALPARLERYIIADDVRVEDVTEDFALLHVTNDESVSYGREIRSERFGCGGFDLWLPSPSREAALQELAMRFRRCDEACAESLRIERGIPRWGCELTEEIIPTEANLEARAIDYNKGCYIGQEVISRMKMSGQTNKRLCGVIPLSGGPLVAGMRLTSQGKDAGWITSVTRSEALGKEIALAFVKRGFPEELTAAEGESSTQVKVTALPFL